MTASPHISLDEVWQVLKSSEASSKCLDDEDDTLAVFKLMAARADMVPTETHSRAERRRNRRGPLKTNKGPRTVKSTAFSSRSAQVPSGTRTAKTVDQTSKPIAAPKVTSRQFRFDRKWKRLVEPLLNARRIQALLGAGMKAFDPDWRHGEAPADIGHGSINGQRVVPGKLSAYQPWGRCHWIAPFVLGLASAIYPDDQWFIISGDRHAVVTNSDESMVFDILLFQSLSPAQSLRFAKEGEALRIGMDTVDVWIDLQLTPPDRWPNHVKAAISVIPEQASR